MAEDNFLPPPQPPFVMPPPGPGFGPMPDNGRGRNRIDGIVEIFSMVFGWLKQREPITVVIIFCFCGLLLFFGWVFPKQEAQHTQQIKDLIAAFERSLAAHERSQVADRNLIQTLLLTRGHTAASVPQFMPDNLVLRPIVGAPSSPQE
ncbi:hypothetical protein Pan44_26850 [Caulifigura coniformis]|uniref:Uncharacterized protein n=1 Tax=Caulifigura coniformis TaxID=2527983 RepID=A0A517SEY8_9PLAN|nr:hypothetical protein [Caulifigura coniformis]QDT54650.1 hypothetical protein Pan44_26850 [Caulifigura coniformis]